MAGFQLDYTGQELNEVSRKGLNPYHSHTYIALGTTTDCVIGALDIGNWVKCELDVTAKSVNGFGLFDPGGPDQALQLQATGITDRLFELNVSTGVASTVGNVDTEFSLFIDDGGGYVQEPGVYVPRTIGLQDDKGAMPIAGTFIASTGDRLGVYVRCDKACTLTFIGSSLFINEVKE
jgi:hypothetical protein